ncbi:aldo/keto reductase [Thermophagus sp. OGC60D27]|uniref:aldo/keto reductase n=1 Tax=Thermophagus sp. OGC60D27 TaxID=3458415 RepID=UPI004037F67E
MQTRRGFIRKVALSASALMAGNFKGYAAGHSFQDERGHYLSTGKEWRNKQSGMSYRLLGRTGMMVSEMVIGGGGLNPDKYKYIGAAIEKGVNYVDTASRYGRGRSEQGVREVLKMAGREKLFVSTKISSYLPFIDQLTRDLFNELPPSKQKSLLNEARQLIVDRGVDRSGYYYKFFPTQDKEFPDGYLTYVIRKNYGNTRKWKNEIKKELRKTVEQSLIKLDTDYIDVLHCPHGVRVPEEMDDEVLSEMFEDLKKEGKIRFFGVSIHSDVPGNLMKAADSGVYDMAMVAYNIVNQGSVDVPLRKACESGLGIIAMKAASAVFPPHDSLKPVPQWRIDKLNHAIPGDMKLQLKAYLWVLQNPHVSGVISAFRNEEMIHENLSVVGQKINLKRL